MGVWIPSTAHRCWDDDSGGQEMLAADSDGEKEEEWEPLVRSSTLVLGFGSGLLE